jgi:RNA polymerase sigma-70 factor, ECF subfamily
MSALLLRTKTVDFDRLYRRHAAPVYRYAFAVLGNHADAEDVTQQTFLNAYRAIARGTKPRKPENWLLRIAHNEVRRHFRSVNGKPVEVELDERLAHSAPEESEPSLAEVLRALQHLSPVQRSALVMREFEGRSYAEIAELMNMTQSALEAQLFRARRALAEQLEEAFTCTAAEEAVLRRLDSRLPRRVARRLKAHLQECHVCERFAEVQKRQRALLKGLSVMPVPASLFLFRPDQAAAAGAGVSAVAVGGPVAVGGGTAAAAGAGAGATGVAAGFVAKAAAVGAAAAVAGGVGYGVTAARVPVKEPERKVAPKAIARPAPQDNRMARIATPTIQLDQRAPARRGSTRRPQKTQKAKKPSAALVTAPGNAFAKPEKTSAKRPSATMPARPVKARPPQAAATKPASKAKAPKVRTRPATGKGNARVKPARPTPSQPARGADKPKPSHNPQPGPPPEPPRGPK